MKLVSNEKAAEAIFGRSASSYNQLLRNIGDSIYSEKYEFVDNRFYEQILKSGSRDLGLSQEIYWKEILFRAHFSSVGAIVRTVRWIDVIIREYEARNIYGWASSCRSLLESAGDIVHSLPEVPYALAKHEKVILDRIKGKQTDVIAISSDIENALIHFTDARKVAKSEDAPVSHKAELSSKYINNLNEMEIEGSKELYSQLCEIVHPARTSVQVLFGVSGGYFGVSEDAEREFLCTLVSDSKRTLSGALEASLNPPILTLKVLQRFGVFKQVKGLRKTGLEHIGLWKKIEALS